MTLKPPFPTQVPLRTLRDDTTRDIDALTRKDDGIQLETYMLQDF